MISLLRRCRICSGGKWLVTCGLMQTTTVLVLWGDSLCMTSVFLQWTAKWYFHLTMVDVQCVCGIFHVKRLHRWQLQTRCCGADFDECIQRCIGLVISSPDPLKKCDARVRIISWCHVLLFLWCCCVFGSYFCDRYFLGIRCKWYIWSIVR